MPFLDEETVQRLLVEARGRRFDRICPSCGRTVVKDYCRSCDEFYMTHGPECETPKDHSGHRLTVIPFVEAR